MWLAETDFFFKKNNFSDVSDFMVLNINIHCVLHKTGICNYSLILLWSLNKNQYTYKIIAFYYNIVYHNPVIDIIVSSRLGNIPLPSPFDKREKYKGMRTKVELEQNRDSLASNLHSFQD